MLLSAIGFSLQSIFMTNLTRYSQTGKKSVVKSDFTALFNEKEW